MEMAYFLTGWLSIYPSQAISAAFSVILVFNSPVFIQEVTMKIVVIGSGMAGLTAAAALGQRGHPVTIFEQNPQPGGVTAPFQLDGFRFDMGQLLLEGLAEDEPVGAILKELDILRRIQVVKDDRGYVFPDFEIRKPQEYGGIRWRMDALKKAFPQESVRLDRYFKDYLRFTRILTLARRMEKANPLSRLALTVRLYQQLLPLLSRKDWSAKRMMKDYFRSEKLRLVFTSILADFFTPPSQFIGLGVFALNAEASFEKRMPRLLAPGAEQLYHYSILGGIGTLVEAYVARIAELGGKILTGVPVTNILVENNQVTGVLDRLGNRHSADLVFASGGVKETFHKLIGPEKLSAEFTSLVARQPLMDSTFMVHAGIDFDPRPHVHGAVTYYYGTYDIEGAIAEARQGIYHQGRAGFVIHVPSIHTPQMAPSGHHSLTIYTICPDTLAAGSWPDRKEEYADQLLAAAENYIPDLRRHVVHRAVITPEDWRRITHLDHHAFGGLAPVMGRPRVPHQTPIQGLWFIGAQSESGGGVNNVIPAAYQAALRAIQ